MNSSQGKINQLENLLTEIKKKRERGEKIELEEIKKVREILYQLLLTLLSGEGSFPQYLLTELIGIVNDKEKLENPKVSKALLLPYLAVFDEGFEKELVDFIENPPDEPQVAKAIAEVLVELEEEEGLFKLLNSLLIKHPQGALELAIELLTEKEKFRNKLLEIVKRNRHIPGFPIEKLMESLTTFRDSQEDPPLSLIELAVEFGPELRSRFGQEAVTVLKELLARLKEEKTQELTGKLSDIIESPEGKGIPGIILKSLSEQEKRRRLVEIAKDSVFPIYIKGYINGKRIAGNGTAFVYKQVREEERYRSYFLTNLHNVQAIHQILAQIEENFSGEDSVEIKITAKIDGRELEIEEFFVPVREIYEQLLLENPMFRRFDVAVFTISNDRKREFFGISREPQVEIGEELFAFGYPSGLNLSMAQGIASQIYDRSEADNPMAGSLFGTIQHTVLINPGNSGGPTVRSNGEVVGISTFGLASGVGLNFSISQRVINEYLKDRNFFRLFKVKEYLEKAIQDMKIRRI